MSTTPAHGWVEAADPKSGRTYFYNKLTKKTQWTRPAELEAGTAAAAPDGAPAAAAAAGGQNPEDIAANWREATDPKSGRVYYFCKTTNKTR